MDGVGRSRGRFSLSAIINYLLVALQFICAIIVLGIIAVRFNRTAFSTACYVIFLCVLTIITALALGFLTYRPSQSRMIILGSCIWQAVMTILWAAAAGALANRSNRYSNGVRAAIALSVIELICFLASTLIISFGLWRGRRATGGIKGTV